MKSQLLLTLPLCLLLATSAESQTLQTRVAQGEITLVKASGGWRLDQGKNRSTIPVPASVHFWTLQPAGDAVIATGTDLSGPAGARSYSLVVLRGQGGKFETLPTPAVAAGAMALAPQAVVGPGGLEALLWIEGENEQAGAVKAARWNGSAFETPSTLSPVGPGTQIGLQVARLEGGAMLAVWSAFDGQDDEITWSRGDSRGWSAPQTLTSNQVPDVTPALRANGPGALLVWSFYDGNDYRLRSARFNGSTFNLNEIFGGIGATQPTFILEAENAVAYRQVGSEGWKVAELSAEGKKEREASLPVSGRRLPSILGRNNEGLLIEVSATDATQTPVSILVPWDEKNDE